MVNRIKALKAQQDALRVFGIADFKAQVTDQVAAHKAQVRARLPRTKAVSDTDVEHMAFDELSARFQRTFTDNLAKARRVFTRDLATERTRLARDKRINRRPVEAADPTWADTERASAVEMATLRELQRLNARADREELKRDWIGVGLTDRLAALEFAAAHYEGLQDEWATQVAAHDQKVVEAGREPETYREGSVSLAKKARARVVNEMQAALAPRGQEIAALRDLVEEELARPLTPQPGETPEQAVVRALKGRGEWRARVDAALDRVVPAAVRAEEREAEQLLAEIEESHPILNNILNEAIAQGRPIDASRSGKATPSPSWDAADVAKGLRELADDATVMA